MVEAEEGFEQLTESLVAFGSQTEELSQATVGVTSRLQDLGNHPDRASARQMRSLVMGLAQKLGDYAKFLSAENKKYSGNLERTRTSLESIVRAQNPHTPEERSQIESLVSHLDSLHGICTGSLGRRV